MESTARRGGGPFEGLYKFVMRRNSVYVTFVVVGAFLGERKRYEDIPVLGTRQAEE
ncbi:hypothetical protein QJS10_CPA02g00980 [Acorus calamus]|uniref:Complex III subunit 9 n=1 Tax=Acorus calamus TaxID=4465 RepID=A0AAV9FBL7_ACOCL|nr:hypothetical protein QJS10_CPA02g00980 [Acorus calamus]